ncbi:MAG TPA: response regulator [Candidatus Omnitrophota bacterium]|nr:response regulator [Candidatus Omnitrophota bacterium]HPN88443.1 response regulator [Candidatus Omnitrophota bacterium]
MAQKILLIDDDRINLKIIQPQLVNQGFEVFLAFNGAEGLKVAVEKMPDLIVLDVEMPEMNGYTFMVNKNKDERIKSIPVIVLTSHQENQPIFQLKGVKAYLIKPIDVNRLLDRIQGVLGSI